VDSVKSEDSSSTDSAEESFVDARLSVKRTVKKRERKPSTASATTAQNKVSVGIVI